MFPHAVLHSAALSFLGFGLAAHEGLAGSAAGRCHALSGRWRLVAGPLPGMLTLVLLQVPALQQLVLGLGDTAEFDLASGLAGAAVCSDDALQQLLWHRSEPC